MFAAVAILVAAMGQQSFANPSELGDGITREEVEAFYDKQLKAGDAPRYPTLGTHATMKTGHVGCFRYNPQPGEAFVSSRLLQVVDEMNCVVEMEVWKQAVVVIGPGASGLGRPESYGTFLVWLTDASTEGQVDDKPIKLGGLYEVAGTKSYTTVAGARKTVFMLKPTTLPKPPAAPDKPPAASKPATPKDPSLREWHTASGVIRGRFQRVTGAGVRIIKEDGKPFYVQLKDLTPEERAYVDLQTGR